MKIAMTKKLTGLLPTYNRDFENYNKLKVGETYEFEVKRNRRLLHHRKFWAILSLVCANSDKWPNPESLLIALKMKLGYFNVVPGFDGTEIIHTGSIEFSKMDQDKFSKFYDAALPILAAEIGSTVAELESNLGEYL
jgi:hypothetical protein